MCIVVGILQERGKPAPKGLCFFQDSSGKQKMEVEYLNQKKPTIIEHLAFLSVQHGVYLAELFQALVTAREQGTATCETLTVEYRGSVGKEAIFLITKDGKVVVQFRVAAEFLLKKDIRFETWMDSDKIRKHMAKQNCGPRISTLVQDLRHGMRKVNVEAQVLETPNPSLVYTRYGNRAMVTNAWIEDETGKILLCLWNEQADSVTEGDTVQIKNASVSTFKGVRQLCLGRNGTINILQSHAARKQQPIPIAKTPIYA